MKAPYAALFGLLWIVPQTAPADVELNYQQIISFSAGPFRPTSASISKGTYVFNYDEESTHSVVLEVGGATRLFWLGGAFYLSSNLAYTRFSGFCSPSVERPVLPNESLANALSLSVNFFGLDSRIIYAWEWFPIHWLIPFFEAGYTYTLYSQFGSSDFDSVQGGTGNMTAAGGIRFWLNPSASVKSDNTESHFSLPIFLNIKWNKIFSNGQPLDLANSGLLFSASFGL